MSKKHIDQFLGKKTKSPLNSDKIYGGLALKSYGVIDIPKTVKKIGILIVVATNN